MDLVKEWAVPEFKKLVGGLLELDDLRQMLDNLVNLDSASINAELSGLLDFTNKEVKKFIKEFLKRVEFQRTYASEAKRVEQETNQLNKQMGGGTHKSTKVVRDLSTLPIRANRKICYCQCTKHPLINNCVSCGKIICELEGEGPCLFCGAWVDRDQFYDDLEQEDKPAYDIALEHRDRLIEYDVNAARRLGVIDERQDWYELSNNTWLNKEQRQYANQMLEVEQKRKDEMDSTMNVTLDLENATTDLKMNEVDQQFTFDSQMKGANEFMQSTTSTAKQGKFRPYENADELAADLDEADQAKKMESFQFKACTLTNSKDLDLYAKLNPDAAKKAQNEAKSKAKQKKNVFQVTEKSKIEDVDNEPQPNEVERMQFLTSSLSQRLQTENPFDHFRDAVEKAFIEKQQKKKDVWQGDMDYFKEQDDVGMCLSMHQPWASMLVHGFKRFEGRSWNHKYRGPVWIHSTSQKPSSEDILNLENAYRSFYRDLGENMPPFPDRYVTSHVIGRLDLIDIISLDECIDTVPQKLREPSTSAFQFIVRNPMYLDIPLKMSGQPGIYKLPKEILLGAKSLLKKAPVSWWPTKEYRLYSLGRFDLYPLDQADITDKDLAKVNARAPTIQVKDQLTKTNMGCFHVKQLYSIKEQQDILNSVRSQTQIDPQNFKFSRCETLASAIETDSNKDFDYSKKQNRAADKLNCYVQEVLFKDVTDTVKSVAINIEEAVNLYQGQTGGIHHKMQYKKFTFDFYKEDGGSSNRIHAAVDGKKKQSQRNLIQYIMVCIGDSIELEYTVRENEVTSYDYNITLQSGDAFVVNQKVFGFSYQVKKIKQDTKSPHLILREGALLLQIEKE